MEKDEQLTLRISSDLLKEIKALVEEIGIPRASVLRLALMEGTRYLRERYGKRVSGGIDASGNDAD